MEGETFGPFCLIKFIESDGAETISTVPSGWISTDKNVCYWPENLNRIALDRLRSDPKSKFESDWTAYQCIIKRPNVDTMKDGRALERVYEDLTDTDAEVR